MYETNEENLVFLKYYSSRMTQQRREYSMTKAYSTVQYIVVGTTYILANFDISPKSRRKYRRIHS